MIDAIKAEIVKVLKATYPLITKRYLDDNIPQNFSTPSFFLNVVNHEYGKRLNTKYNATVTFDLGYFSDKVKESIKGDCLTVQQGLLRALDIAGTYRILNKDARITDDVLHITFDVRYSELVTDTETTMETMTQTTEL